MSIRVTYTKNLVSGAKKGTKYVEEQVVDSKRKSLALQLLLMEITDLHPQTDPVTDCLCYVTNISEEVLEKPEFSEEKLLQIA